MKNPKSIKVSIDAACDIYYSSYYIYGIWIVFGKENVSFSNTGFSNFNHNNSFFCFIVKDENREQRIVIDFFDGPELNAEAYAWCHVYGKVNPAFNSHNTYNKLLAIGPGFGIKIFNAVETVWFSLQNFLLAKHRIQDKRRFFGDYKNQLLRASINDYLNRPSSIPGFIYHIGTLWKKEPATNLFRANFMTAAKLAGFKFEGGFAPRVKNDIAGFESLTMPGRHNFKTYLHKSKQSAVVFNTPAVLSCHGWKLGEFMAMGKCFISTSLTREMPSALNDGKEYLLTDGSVEDIKNLLDNLDSDELMRKQLEQNAAHYFDQWLHPSAVIQRLYTFVNHL